MSTSTYLQLCQDTQSTCGITGTSIASVTGQTGILKKLVRWVADADVDVQRLHINWDFLYVDSGSGDAFSQTTAIGGKDFTKPSVYGKWDKDTFFLDHGTTDYHKLQEQEYRKWYNVDAADTQTNGQPDFFIIKPGGDLILSPPADVATYTFTANYWRTPKRMSGNTDTSLIPENYIRAIIAKAKMYYAIDQEAQEVYIEAQGEYTQVLSELRADQLPGWEEYNISDNVELTVTTDGFTDFDSGY